MRLQQGLTVLSFGGGQDSTAILLKMLYNPVWRRKYAPGKLVVIMSDTGNEHPYTYEHVNKMKGLCASKGIPFFLITADMGYHTPAWPDLLTPQLRESGGKFKTTMVQLKTKTCTDKLKIVPIYKFLDWWLNEEMGYGFARDQYGACGKQAYRKFVADHGPIRVLLGFAKGEESRADKSRKLEASQARQLEKELAKGKVGPWEAHLRRIYPLIEEGMDRQACAEYIESTAGYEVMPSNCMLCPYQSLPEILWLYRNHPTMWETWVRIEANKIQRYEGKIEKNHGVYNTKKLLPHKLQEAQAKFGHMTDSELHEYKKFHGCATNAM